MTPSRLSRRTLLAALACAGVLSPALVLGPAWAADALDQLRAAGALGERYDGLLVLRDANAAGAAATVEQVNAKRRKIYAQRASETGATVEQTGAIYAQQIMAKAPKGTYFLQKDGKWIRK